jgi:hypothetical protein|tara:strand:- start:3106 stop:3333 length:228 start_codon:yes stop_codon:yes gene_type:complete
MKKHKELNMQIEFSQVTDIVIGGVEMYDYPDFCDAYVEEASFEDGTPLTDDQLNAFNELEETLCYVNENAYTSLF